MDKTNTKPAISFFFIQMDAPTTTSTEEKERFYNDLKAVKDKMPCYELSPQLEI